MPPCSIETTCVAADWTIFTAGCRSEDKPCRCGRHAVVGALPLAGAADPSVYEIRESATRVFEDESFQTEFPGEQGTDLRESGGSRSLSSSRGWRSGSRGIDMRPIQSVAGIISLLLWIAIVAIFAVLVGWVAREAVLMARRERIHRSAPDELAVETERSARFSLDLAKNLAAEGEPGRCGSGVALRNPRAPRRGWDGEPENIDHWSRGAASGRGTRRGAAKSGGARGGRGVLVFRWHFVGPKRFPPLLRGGGRHPRTRRGSSMTTESRGEPVPGAAPRRDLFSRRLSRVLGLTLPALLSSPLSTS